MDPATIREDTGDTASLSLSRREAQLLESQLARDVARMEDELDEAGEGATLLSRQIDELRHLDARLRQLLDELEPLPEVV